ncbi:alpha/beta fold hydrolase [Lysobacter antibioticus]|uniref:alpha/beta fold hydrolase n=1 Tax=Lysobacter antibioticus TaxID=84531 RepID=UPI00071728F8|nr:alpha/beta hydrolase [Lysobacter antibioticus]
MTPMRCIVLPGMDGTGELLSDFVAAMAPEFATEVIAYPRDRPLGYDELVARVRPQLPTDEPYLLIGESFSGPIAIRLAASKPPSLAGLVLCASFARAPRPPGSPLNAATLARLAGLLPLARMPTRWVATAMLGRWSSPQWRARLGPLLASLDPAVMRHRLREGGAVDVTAALAEIACPLLYLRARRDRLVSADSWRSIGEARPDARCIEIDAPHFLLQAHAPAAAAAVRAWHDEFANTGGD